MYKNINFDFSVYLNYKNVYAAHSKEYMIE